MMAADSFRRWKHGEENGEEDEGAAVDERRCPHVEDARTRRGEDYVDCAEAEADRRRHASASIQARRVAGGRSEGESVIAARVIIVLRRQCRSTARGHDHFLARRMRQLV